MNAIVARVDEAIPGLKDLLQGHPFVELDPRPATKPVEFDQGHWHRSVESGARDGLRGLVELADNNPLVCADSFSVPDPGTTLALVALGPLVRAGMLVEPPHVVASFEVEEAAIENYLADAGWAEGAVCHSEHQPEQAVVALNAMALIKTPDNPDDLDALYDEAYGRSFFVRRIEEGDWDVDLVQGKPWAAYRLRLTEGEPHSLLTIQTMADRQGKVGAAQIVHAMNVMAGFEESLGVA